MNGRTRDGRTRSDLRLRPARGLAHVLVGDQRDQKHQAHIAEGVKNALPTLSESPADASLVLRLTHGGPSVRRSECMKPGAPSLRERASTQEQIAGVAVPLAFTDGHLRAVKLLT